MKPIRNLDDAINLRFFPPPRRALIQASPHLRDIGALGGQHAVLQAVHVLAVDGRHELAGREVEDDARGKVVPAKAGTELEVLVEHFSEREGNGLRVIG